MDDAREAALADHAKAGRDYSRLSLMFRTAIANDAGVNVTDAECLDFLLEAGSATAGQLAELTGLTTGAITSVIRRLTSAGYVTTQHDPADRRRLIITLRMENLAASASHYNAFATRAQELLASYTNEDLEFLTRHYQRMSAIYKAEIERLNSTD